MKTPACNARNGAGGRGRPATPKATLTDRTTPKTASVATAKFPRVAPKVALPPAKKIARADNAKNGGAASRCSGAGNGAGELNNYRGGKNGSGIYQRIINQIPPHDMMIEAFYGSGAITRRIRRAPRVNIGIDIDPAVIAAHSGRGKGVTLIEGCALKKLRWLAARMTRTTFIYCDPPYLGSARAWPDRDCYRHEMKDEAKHRELLQILKSVPAMVMISGYRCALYDGELTGWRRIDYQAMTRCGMKAESLWCNYPQPKALHDYRFLGRDHRERTRIARKIKRLRGKLERLPVLERAALLVGIGVVAAEGCSA